LKLDHYRRFLATLFERRTFRFLTELLTETCDDAV
jgi:hypothetical protein